MSKRIRKRLLWLTAAAIILVYVLSYIAITQYRYEQFRGYNACGFWYVSCEDETSKSWERKERAMQTFYGPLQYIEHCLLERGMSHASCSPFFRIGK